MLNFTDNQHVDVSVRRNTMRLLQFIDVPKRYRAKVIALGFRFLVSKNEPVAVKVFSITVLSRTIKTEPDLKGELRLVIEDQLPFSSTPLEAEPKKYLKY